MTQRQFLFGRILFFFWGEKDWDVLRIEKVICEKLEEWTS